MSSSDSDCENTSHQEYLQGLYDSVPEGKWSNDCEVCGLKYHWNRNPFFMERVRQDYFEKFLPCQFQKLLACSDFICNKCRLMYSIVNDPDKCFYCEKNREETEIHQCDKCGTKICEECAEDDDERKICHDEYDLFRIRCKSEYDD